jgi:hypothetical protein
VLRSFDAKGVSSYVTGTFTVIAAIPPAIADVAVVETSDPNGTLEPMDKLAITWKATTQHKIASQSVMVDGKAVRAAITRSPGGVYSCAIGKFAIGNHKFVIKSTDSKGTSSRSSGAFDVIAALTSATSTMSRRAGSSITDVHLAAIVAETVQQYEPVSVDEMAELAAGSVGQRRTSALDEVFASF